MNRSFASKKKKKLFYPKEFLKKVLPKGFWRNDLLNKFSVKRQTLRAITTSKAINGREIKASIYRTIAEYERKYESLIGLKDLSKSEAYDEIVKEEALLRQRIENAVMYDEVQELKEEHAGESYRWLSSDSKTPRPQHQLLYGKIFKVGQGDSNGNMPGEDYGCRCGIEFLGAEK